MPDGPPVFFDLGDRDVANRQCNCTKPLVRDRPQGEAEMSKRPDAKWMCKEDDQLRAAEASGGSGERAWARLVQSSRKDRLPGAWGER